MPKGELTSEYNYLLDNSDFRRWYENIKRGSVVTAHTWLRRVGFVHKKLGKTPQDLVKMNSKQAANFLMDTISTLEKEGRGGSYISGVIKPLKNWFDFNDIHIQQRIKIRGRDELVKFGDERTPTPDELGKVLNMGDSRARSSCALVAFTGVRLEVLGDYLGTDGLKIADLPEMTLRKKTVEFQQTPTTIRVRKKLSKTNNPFITFLCEEGCNYLKEYLEWRIRRGEKLTPESPVITPLQQKLAGEHIRTINIGDMIRKPIRAAGFKWRPYVLRRYFDTRLMMAESDGLIIRDYRTFWMGHKGDIEHTYTVNKGLSKDVVEKMRNAYARAAEKYLATTKRETVNQEMVVSTFNQQFLTMAGYTIEEIQKLGELAKLSAKDMQELIQKKSMTSLGLNGNSRQRVVPMNDVKNWIIEGWEYISELPTHEAIIRLPV